MANRFEKYAQTPPPEEAKNRFAKYKAAKGVIPEAEETNLDPTAEMSGFDKVRAGFGSGLVRGVKGAANLAPKLLNLGPQGLAAKLTGTPSTIQPPDFATDEKLQEQDKLDEPLAKTGAGATGQLLGQVASTLPLGMATGPATAASTGTGMLARTLGSRAGLAALEGTVGGAMYADPEKQGTGAAAGGILSGTLSKVGQAGGRVLKGVVKKSPEAQELIQLAQQHGRELFLPISQAADEAAGGLSKAGKFVYKNVLPFVLGAGGRIKGQANKAAEMVRELALEEALPKGMTLPLSAGRKTTAAVDAIKAEFDKTYDETIKRHAFSIPEEFDSDLRKVIQSSAGGKNASALTKANTKINSTTEQEIVDKVKALTDKFSDGTGVLDGTNLLNVRREISELISDGADHEKVPLEAVDGYLNKLVHDQLSEGKVPENLADLARYEELTPAWRNFVPVKKASDKAVAQGGQFTGKQLAESAGRSDEQRAIGQLAAQTVDQPAGMGNVAGKIALGAGSLGLGVGTYMGVPGMAAAGAGGNLLANKSTQKMLYGDYNWQKAMIEALRKNSEKFRMTGAAARQAAATEAGDDYGSP